MSTLYFESDAPDDVRRHRIYDGDVFVYAPRESTRAFTEFARELIEAAFAPLDPRAAQFELPVEQFVEIVAPLNAGVHPPPGVEAADRGDPRRARLRSRQDLLRRAPHARPGPRRLPHRGRGLPAAPAPRHLVRGAALAGELLAAGLPDLLGVHLRVLPEVLPQPGAERLRPLRHVRVERESPEERRQRGPQGLAVAADGARSARPRDGVPSRLPAGRPHHVLGRAPARDRCRTPPGSRVSASTSARSTATTSPSNRVRRSTTRSGGARPCARTCGRATSSRSPRTWRGSTTPTRRPTRCSSTSRSPERPPVRAAASSRSARRSAACAAGTGADRVG